MTFYPIETIDKIKTSRRIKKKIETIITIMEKLLREYVQTILLEKSKVDIYRQLTPEQVQRMKDWVKKELDTKFTAFEVMDLVDSLYKPGVEKFIKNMKTKVGKETAEKPSVWPAKKSGEDFSKLASDLDVPAKNSSKKKVE